MSLYLGLDSSTQSLTAVVIEVERALRRVVWQASIRFDQHLPQYGTRNGVLAGDDPLVAHSPPLVWADALDTLLAKLSSERAIDLSRLRAVAGSGQQHGSVYLDASAAAVLANLDASRPLVAQIPGIFARETSPIWMDSSTGAECAEIEAAVGGPQALGELTGSKAFERFTGPQIRKFWKSSPDAYARSDRIHLVSSFMATLLAGKHAPIDPGDGAGMNLMDLAGKFWAPAALEATAPGLLAKLPELRESWSIVGPIAPYWVKRHGFSSSTRVVAWSGDNPCSLIGVGLVEPGLVAISLGTSDTLFGYLPYARVDPAAEGHAFGAPTGDYMSLICFKNGSLARERIRERHGLDWAGFSAALRRTRPGNGACVLLPWFEPEITPHVDRAGVRRYGLDEDDADANVRAVIEGQMMTMSNHSRWMGVARKSIYATGGASCNREILRVMADVFDADVYQFEVGNSAALGAALRAFHADEVAAGRQPGWKEVVREFAEPVLESRIVPEASTVRVYRDLQDAYAACERHALGIGEDPAPALRRFGEIHGAK